MRLAYNVVKAEMAMTAVPLKLMSPGKQPEKKSKSERGKTIAEQSKKSRTISQIHDWKYVWGGLGTIAPGDRLLSVDVKSLGEKISNEDLIRMVLGERGSSVCLQIQYQNGQSEEENLIRPLEQKIDGMPPDNIESRALLKLLMGPEGSIIVVNLINGARLRTWFAPSLLWDSSR